MGVKFGPLGSSIRKFRQAQVHLHRRFSMRVHTQLAGLLVFALIAPILASAATTNATVTFNNVPLTTAQGSSEPSISIGSDGTMAIDALGWLFPFGTQLWTGHYGSTPTLRGAVDSAIQKANAVEFGGGDADVSISSDGTLHLTTLVILINKPFRAAQIAVSAINCGQASSANITCAAQIVDLAGNDRPWITTDGSIIYISYHDAKNSSLIRVQRSDDGGVSWTRVGDPVVGQGSTTGSSTFNNIAGPIVADSASHAVYDVYAAGQTGITKAKTTDFRKVFVSRSFDFGKSWTAALVYSGPAGTTNGNVFPVVATDPVTHAVYASWSDGSNTFFSASTDNGATWSPAVIVNIAPATTAIFPWIAAYNGTVDVVYYGTSSSSNTNTASWNVYFAQTTNNGASFIQSVVDSTANHTGVICTQGTACAPGTRNLLDLFEVAIDPPTGKAAIVYVNDLLTPDVSGNRLPQTVLAQQ